MGINPTRFAIAVSASLASLAVGLLLGVSAGGSHTAHVLQVETVTTTTGATAQAPITHTVTVPRIITVATTVTPPPKVIDVAYRWAVGPPGVGVSWTTPR